jgi:hypothetical protein
MPSQSINNINLLTNSTNGSLVYDSTNNLAKVLINGIWQDINFSPSPLTLPISIANGGTGKTTQADAITALSGTQIYGYYLRSDGTNTYLNALSAGDLTGILSAIDIGAGLVTDPVTSSSASINTALNDVYNAILSPIPIQLSVDTTINSASLVVGVSYIYESISVSVITLTIIGGATIRNPPTLNGSSTTIGFNQEDNFTLTKYSDNTILLT